MATDFGRHWCSVQLRHITNCDISYLLLSRDSANIYLGARGAGARERGVGAARLLRAILRRGRPGWRIRSASREVARTSDRVADVALNRVSDHGGIKNRVRRLIVGDKVLGTFLRRHPRSARGAASRGGRGEGGGGSSAASSGARRVSERENRGGGTGAPYRRRGDRRG